MTPAIKLDQIDAKIVVALQSNNKPLLALLHEFRRSVMAELIAAIPNAQQRATVEF